MFATQYGKWSTMKRLTNTDPKTLRKWIGLFFDAVELIEAHVVSLKASLVMIISQLLFHSHFHSIPAISLVALLLSYGSGGRITAKVTSGMVAWCLLMEQTFRSLTMVVNFIHTNINLVPLFNMKLLFVLEQES